MSDNKITQIPYGAYHKRHVPDADADSLSSKDRRNFILARPHELDDGVHEEA